jgi:hypothetical protein
MFLSKGSEPRIEVRTLNYNGNAADVNFIVLNLSQVRVLLQAVEKIDDASANILQRKKLTFHALIWVKTCFCQYLIDS